MTQEKGYPEPRDLANRPWLLMSLSLEHVQMSKEQGSDGSAEVGLVAKCGGACMLTSADLSATAKQAC